MAEHCQFMVVTEACGREVALSEAGTRALAIITFKGLLLGTHFCHPDAQLLQVPYPLNTAPTARERI